MITRPAAITCGLHHVMLLARCAATVAILLSQIGETATAAAIAEFDPNPDITSSAVIGPSRTWAQTFTAETTAAAGRVDLMLNKNDFFTPAQLGNVTIELRETTAGGPPFNDVLAAVTVASASIPAGPLFDGSFASFDIPDQPLLNAGSVYALIVSTDSQIDDNPLGPYFWSGASTDKYAGGESFIRDNTSDSSMPGVFAADGSDRGFRIAVPEPASLSLLALVLLVSGGIRLVSRRS